MMSKERLGFDLEREMKHLKKIVDKDDRLTISSRFMKYFIEQTERTEHLERENAGLHDILAQIEYQEKDKLLAENKRYREAIKGAIGKFNYDYHQEGMAELLKALEESE